LADIYKETQCSMKF